MDWMQKELRRESRPTITKRINNIDTSISVTPSKEFLDVETGTTPSFVMATNGDFSDLSGFGRFSKQQSIDNLAQKIEDDSISYFHGEDFNQSDAIEDLVGEARKADEERFQSSIMHTGVKVGTEDVPYKRRTRLPLESDELVFNETTECKIMPNSITSVIKTELDDELMQAIENLDDEKRELAYSNWEILIDIGDELATEFPWISTDALVSEILQEFFEQFK